MTSQDYRETLKEFEVPTAIFYAEPGSLFDPLTATFMEEKIGKNAILVPFTNASHALVFSHTNQFTEEVISFVK
jgi:pimeloyl-ACP methyl ester carboxylesterase